MAGHFTKGKDMADMADTTGNRKPLNVGLLAHV